MDEQIEQIIINHLRDKGYTSAQNLLDFVVAGSPQEPNIRMHATKVLLRMEDREEVEIKRDGERLSEVRLRHQGLDAHKPFKEKMWDYLGDNWLALAAMAFSLLSLIIDYGQR